MQGLRAVKEDGKIDRFFKDTSPHTALLIQNVGDWEEETARQMKTPGCAENISKHLASI